MASDEMTKPERTDDVVSTSTARRTLNPPRTRVAALLVLTLLAVLLGQGWLRWAYHMQRASSAMSAALSWPAPRLVDSLPQQTDGAAAERAMAHLQSARDLRPDHPFAYAQLAELHLAARDLAGAAELIEQAEARAPADMALAWRAGQIYEEMFKVVNDAPADYLLDTLLTGQLEREAGAPQTPYCGGDARSCVLARAVFKQPHEALPDGRPIGADVLFQHPPSRLRSTVRIAAERPALHVLLGLDPQAPEGVSDGATYRIWVQPAGSAETLVYERALDGATAHRGWTAAWVDLSAYAGQELTLILGVDGGPAGNIDGDWYGWGNPRLTTVEAAHYSMFVPETRMIESWLSAGITESQLIQRGAEATRSAQPQAALTWYWRAGRLNPVSWNAVHQSGRAFAAQRDFKTAASLYRRALEIQPNNYAVSISLAEALWQQGERAQAHTLLAQAIERDPQRTNAYLTLGALQEAEADLSGAKESYARALALNPKNKRIQTLLDKVSQQ